MKVTNGHIHELYKKTYFLSQFLSQNTYFLYNNNDQSEHDYYSKTTGDYVLNTLLVVSLVCLSFCLFVCLFVCLSVLQFFGNGLIYAYETLRPSYICSTPEAY